MDNVKDLSEVQSSVGKPRIGSLLKVTRLDPVTATGQEMQDLWQKLKTQDYAFDDLTRDNASAFVLGLVAPASFHFLINDSAYVVCRGVWLDSNVDFHFVIWDRDFPFKDVLEAGRQILEWLFKEQGVCRVSGYIPKFNPLAVRLATTMGFKYEGTMRRAIKFHEEFHDVDLYGLLPKEFERRFQQ